MLSVMFSVLVFKSRSNKPHLWFQGFMQVVALKEQIGELLIKFYNMYIDLSGDKSYNGVDWQ